MSDSAGDRDLPCARRSAAAATCTFRERAILRKFDKICPSCVSGRQNEVCMVASGQSRGTENTMMRILPDHGLPLVQLKEQRRDLVVALQNRNGPVSGWELMQIAAIQQAIQAFEDVIADLAAEMEAAA
jgi:hypothetical protein